MGNLQGRARPPLANLPVKTELRVFGAGASTFSEREEETGVQEMSSAKTGL